MAHHQMTTTKAGRFPAFVVLLACISLLLNACHRTPDEEQIRQAITAMTQAVESGKFGDLAKYLHQDFRANDELTAEQVKQMLTMYGMQHQAISISVVSSKTVIDPVYKDRAESTLSVISTSGTSFAGLPSDGSARVVKLQWRKDGDWKVLKANWQE